MPQENSLISADSELPPILQGQATPQVEEKVRKFLFSVAAIYESWLGRRTSPQTRRSYDQDVMNFARGYLGLRWPADAAKFLQVSVQTVQGYRDSLVANDAALMNGNDIISPNSADAELAKESSRSLATRLGRANGRLFEVRDEETGETLKLPTPAVRALLHVLTEMGQGHSVTVIPIHAELSTQQAADLLNVSRPYLVKLVDEGSIPSRKVGVQRRLLLDDVIAYKREMYAKQLHAMTEVTKLSQEMGLYDEPSK